MVNCFNKRTSIELSDNINFPFQNKTKFVPHRAYNGFRKGVHFVSGSMPVVHQYQCLVLPGACMAGYLALPATLFDQPAGCQFDTVACHRKANHVRDFLPQLFKFYFTDYRILKATARSAGRRVGKECVGTVRSWRWP